MLLGVGTTLGVVVQAALLAPSMVRARLHIRFLWRPAHEAMRTITRLAGWTFGWVLANQVALVIVLALADGVTTPGAVSSYTYAYTFFQLPYGIVAVSVMTAVTPSLAARWAQRDMVAFRHRMAFGLRGILAIIIPSAVGMVLLAHPLIDLVLAHGAETSAEANSTAAALALLRPRAPRLLHLPLHGARLPSHAGHPHRLPSLRGGERDNILFGLVLVGPLGVRGLALSLSIAYTVAALLALAVVRRRVGGLGGDDLTTPVKRVLAASARHGRGHRRGGQPLRRPVGVGTPGPGGGRGGVRRLGLRRHRRPAGGAQERHRRAPAPAAPVPRSRRPDPPLPLPSSPGADWEAPPVLVGPPAHPSSPEPFRGRLDEHGLPVPFRHLRPVSSEPGDAHPAVDEEDIDGPDPGGNR